MTSVSSHSRGEAAPIFFQPADQSIQSYPTELHALRIYSNILKNVGINPNAPLA
jgi:hypothetical protein